MATAAVTLLLHLPVILACGVGIVVSLVAARRRGGSGASLGAMGFALLLLAALLRAVGSMLPAWLSRTMPVAPMANLIGGVSLVANLVAALAVVLLAIALWSASTFPAK